MIIFQPVLTSEHVITNEPASREKEMKMCIFRGVGKEGQFRLAYWLGIKTASSPASLMGGLRPPFHF
jgi:hypothetical protein